MKREVELQRRLRSLEALGEAVGAMKSLSAHHFREARRGIEPARRYREGVERILGWAGASLPGGDGEAGLLDNIGQMKMKIEFGIGPVDPLSEQSIVIAGIGKIDPQGNLVRQQIHTHQIVGINSLHRQSLDLFP